MMSHHRCIKYSAPLALLLLTASLYAAEPTAWQPLGGSAFENWTGLTVSNNIATLPATSAATFRYPQGPKGWYTAGFRVENDSTRDWRSYYGLQLEVRLPSSNPAELQAGLFTPTPALRQEYQPQLHAVIPLATNSDWQLVTIPWSAFALNPSQHATLEFIQQLQLTCPSLQVRNIRLTRAPGLALEADVCGRTTSAGGDGHYNITITNCTDLSQTVKFSFENIGWQAMDATIDHSKLMLAAGESATCVVTVHVPADGVPPGGHETQTLIATAGLAAPAKLYLITARDLPHPNILHTSEEWDAVRDNVKQYDWAQAEKRRYARIADVWNVPLASVPPDNYSVAEQHIYTFPEANFNSAYSAAIAWQLTHDRRYAEKVATFLLRLSDERTGYPSTFAGTNQGSPQEGGNFQGVAIAYDAILDSGVLTDTDRKQIEHTFRLFMATYETDLTVGNVGNWSVAANTACLFCALSMGDLAAADRYIHGPCGFTDYLSKGIMDDGWWWECSTSYNLWVAAELTQSALACRPWGMDLLNLSVPASYSPDTIITPWGLNPPFGISFQKWGPIHRSTRSVKQLWDAIPAAADYRGVVFGMNDGHGERAGGSRLELAYYAFHDPAYSTIIKLANQRDLLYAVPDLPEDSAKPYLKSGYAENLGYALLRSQTPGRPIREQIQAVLKIGTQGGYHGHFDRVSLDNITRYGRDFWYPEAIWWGYPNFMYKFYVQTSINHNMVVVDQMQQEAVPSTQPLFFSGKMMQVAVQETNARWSDPPYGGMTYQPGDTLASQMRKNMQSFPILSGRQMGQLGPYTDRVLQRRVAIVTDDCVVIADYVKSTSLHTFDNLFQMRGFTALDASDKHWLRHDAQWNPDPHRAAQFVTDCDWYSASAPAIGRFTMHYSGDADDTHADLNEPGTLHVDVHSLWPQQQQLMLAAPAQSDGSSQWVTYSVTGDEKPLTHGETGTWILGSVDIDVPIAGITQLALQVSSPSAKKKTLFWSNARFISADGTETPVTAASDESNIDHPPTVGNDYYGGPIKIVGATAINPLPTQPADINAPAVLHIAVPAGAARLKATLGGDYPLGDESQRRKIFASRVQGTEATFLTLLEPYEDQPMVKSATATAADTLRVELTDGRVQELRIQNLNGNAKDVSVTIHETKNGQTVRDEHAGHE